MSNYTRAREDQASSLEINGKKLKMMKKTTCHLPGLVDIMSGCVQVVSLTCSEIRLLGGLFQLFFLSQHSSIINKRGTKDGKRENK